MVTYLERGAKDLQLMPLPPHHLLLQQNPEWFILLVPAYEGYRGKKAVKRLCVYVKQNTYKKPNLNSNQKSTAKTAHIGLCACIICSIVVHSTAPNR